jgi:hypothetical protein
VQLAHPDLTPLIGMSSLHQEYHGWRPLIATTASRPGAPHDIARRLMVGLSHRRSPKVQVMSSVGAGFQQPIPASSDPNLPASRPTRRPCRDMENGQVRVGTGLHRLLETCPYAGGHACCLVDRATS